MRVEHAVLVIADGRAVQLQGVPQYRFDDGDTESGIFEHQRVGASERLGEVRNSIACEVAIGAVYASGVVEFEVVGQLPLVGQSVAIGVGEFGDVGEERARRGSVLSPRVCVAQISCTSVGSPA